MSETKRDEIFDEGIEIQGLLEEPVELDEDAEGEEKPEDIKEEKTVPLAALQKERERLRSLKKEYNEIKGTLERVLENSGIQSPRELMERMDEITMQEFIEKHGMTEHAARLFLMQQKEIEELKKAQRNKDYSAEIQSLKQRPFYADIESVADEVTEYAQKKGITAKEAYNALFAEKRAEELAREAEISGAQSEMERQSRKIPALSSSGSAKSQPAGLNLTKKEIAAARAAGMDPQEYAKYKNMK